MLPRRYIRVDTVEGANSEELLVIPGIGHTNLKVAGDEYADRSIQSRIGETRVSRVS